MKNYVCLTVLVLASFGLYAQDDIVIHGAKQISHKLTPQQIIDSLQKRFPNAKAVKYYKIPNDAAKNGWTVTEENNLSFDEEIDRYTLSFKRDDFQYYGLYNADGRLLMSKFEQTKNNLPESVRQSVALIPQQYPGYKVTEKSYYKNIDHAKSKEYYEVVARKGNAEKRLYYSATGELMKTKG